MNQQYIGEGYVPAYQISATPFVTSSVIADGTLAEIQFPQVTRFLTVKNRNTSAGQDLYVGFTARGLSDPALSNYFIVDAGSSYSEEFRIVSLFLSNSSGTSINYTVIAGLTAVTAHNFTPVTASNGFGGVG